MNDKSLIPYIIPYMIANGLTTYTISKAKEKKIIANFDRIKISRIHPKSKDVFIPEILKNLVKIIENNIHRNNLNNLYNNLENVKIRKNFLMILLGIKGKYNSEKNTLDYSISGSLEHELMHLASAYYDKENKIFQSGFVNYNKTLTFGKALNEGYTDLITRRLFNKKTSFYNEEVRIVEFIELLFDKKELETFYFNNDIVGFINKFSSYISREEAIKFVLSFDRGFELKKLGNPAYKIIYTNLELELCDLFKKHNKSLSKQVDYLKLLDQAIITNAIYQTKKRYLVKE